MFELRFQNRNNVLLVPKHKLDNSTTCMIPKYIVLNWSWYYFSAYSHKIFKSGYIIINTDSYRLGSIPKKK